MFKTIKKDDARHAELANFMTENAGAFDYNGLVQHLNSQEVDTIVEFEFKQGKLGQIRRGLGQRGLVNNVDITVSGGRAAKEDGTEDPNAPFVALVRKISDKQGTPTVARPRGKAAAGDAAPAATATKTAPPKRK